MKNCEFCFITDGDKYNEIYETAYWRVLLTHDQYYLGRCILPLKRHCEALHHVTLEEWLELKQLIDTLEQIFREEFQATLSNWCCHLNNTFKVRPACPHVHFHFRPRYRHAIEFHSLTFRDHEFAHSYSRTRTRHLPHEIRHILITNLRASFYQKIENVHSLSNKRNRRYKTSRCTRVSYKLPGERL